MGPKVSAERRLQENMAIVKQTNQHRSSPVLYQVDPEPECFLRRTKPSGMRPFGGRGQKSSLPMSWGERTLVNARIMKMMMPWLPTAMAWMSHIPRFIPPEKGHSSPECRETPRQYRPRSFFSHLQKAATGGSTCECAALDLAGKSFFVVVLSRFVDQPRWNRYMSGQLKLTWLNRETLGYL
jgi:hypothetical protein